MKYSVIDQCPIPRPLFPIAKKLKADTGCTFNSIYRGTDVQGILHKHGKHSQAELYQMYLNGTGAPANPPGYSTHELRSDGAAYPHVARGGALKWWQCGFDVNDWEIKEVIAAAKKHGWDLRQPYSTSSEYHHLNFTKKPSRWKLFFNNVFKKKKSRKKHKHR